MEHSETLKTVITITLRVFYYKDHIPIFAMFIYTLIQKILAFSPCSYFTFYKLGL